MKKDFNSKVYKVLLKFAKENLCMYIDNDGKEHYLEYEAFKEFSNSKITKEEYELILEELNNEVYKN